MWETLLPNDKNPLLNSKIPQVTTLDKKNRSSIFKAAVSSQQVNRPHYEIDCCYV